MTLEPIIPASGLQETVQAQYERVAVLAMGQSKAEKTKSDNLQKILSLSGLSAENKLKMISQLPNPEKKPGDHLDALAGRFNFRTEASSTVAYGDEKAVAHYNGLPNVQLPPFYGNSLGFAKWWQMFIYLVDKNPKIPQIMKLHLLQKSLKGNAEYLTYQITFSPTSYETLKENVKDAFDDADAALCLLTDRLWSWPTLKRNDYKQLAEFAGFATNYFMQLMHFENGAAFYPRNVVNDLYSKFNPQMMGDYHREWAQEEPLKGKRTDWDQVVWLLEWLKERLKVAKAYHNADHNRQPILLRMPSGIAMEFKNKNQTEKGGSTSNASKGATSEKTKPTVATADGLYTTTEVCAADVFTTMSVRGKGRGYRGAARGAARGRGAPSNRGRGKPPQEQGYGAPSSEPPSTSHNEGAGQNSSDHIQNSQGGQNPLPRQGNGYDLLPYLLCGQHQHPARSCPQQVKPDTVYLKAVEALLCLNCLRMGHYASSCPHPGCTVEGCSGRHHKLPHAHSNQAKRNL